MNFKVRLDRLKKLFLQNLWLTALGWTRMALESSSVRSAFCLVTKAVCSNRLTGRHLEANRCSKRASTELTQGQRSPPPISKCQCVLRPNPWPDHTICALCTAPKWPKHIMLVIFHKAIDRDCILTKGLTKKDEPMIHRLWIRWNPNPEFPKKLAQWLFLSFNTKTKGKKYTWPKMTMVAMVERSCGSVGAALTGFAEMAPCLILLALSLILLAPCFLRCYLLSLMLLALSFLLLAPHAVGAQALSHHLFCLFHYSGLTGHACKCWASESQLFAQCCLEVVMSV